LELLNPEELSSQESTEFKMTKSESFLSSVMSRLWSTPAPEYDSIDVQLKLIRDIDLAFIGYILVKALILTVLILLLLAVILIIVARLTISLIEVLVGYFGKSLQKALRDEVQYYVVNR
jgi:hypothetical protein